MNRFILQQNDDLTIYKNVLDRTYTVETPQGEATGKTIAEALKILSVQVKEKKAKSKKLYK